jgi:hypothetical protein
MKSARITLWKFRLAVALVLVLSILFSAVPASAAVSSDFKVYVMAPLERITDWTAFTNQLRALKNNGVYGITTDVWWGYVESLADQNFDWSYYTNYANAVRASGLKWVPIMSTHACGGNVGDNVNVPIPSWLWNLDTAENMKFKDEAGNFDIQALSPWYSGLTTQYDQLYASFASNFSGYTDIITKIYLSGGPSGEVRYPSYNSGHGWSYPGRGYLECYSTAAITSFRNAMQTKYSTLSALNTSWGTSLTAFSQISPPTNGNAFFTTSSVSSNYGKDFLNWYQGCLASSLASVAACAHNRFDSVFGVPIGAKIAGIHWQYSNPTYPHQAEYCAGYYNYSTMLDQFKNSNLALTFTCLEMSDSDSSPYYSMPSTLVNTVAALANSKAIKLNGENALSISNNTQAYANCASKLTGYSFSGFTLLRLSNLVNPDGSVTSEMSPFVSNIVSLIPAALIPVTFTVNNATTYWGQNIYICGSLPQLANWSTANAIGPASCPNYPTWTITINLPAGTAIEFKAIKKDSSGNVTWEGGSNHTYTVPSSGSGSVNFTWQN